VHLDLSFGHPKSLCPPRPRRFQTAKSSKASRFLCPGSCYRPQPRPPEHRARQSDNSARSSRARQSPVVAYRPVPLSRTCTSTAGPRSRVRQTRVMSWGTSSIGAIASAKSPSSVMLKLASGAGTVIGETQCFLDQAVEIDTPTFAAAATRMLQHALNDVGKICAQPLIFYRRAEP
jgi:hypothetical protein